MMNIIEQLKAEYDELVKEIPLPTEKLSELSRKIEQYERILGLLEGDR